MNQEDAHIVFRRPEADKSLMKNTMKMTGIGELWDLPELSGAVLTIKKGNLKRYAYLKEVNETLSTMETIEEQDVLIETAIEKIENHRNAKYWE